MSSGSDSDEDFVPGEPEQLSEEDSANEETDLQFEKEIEQKSKKRKATSESKDKKKRRTRGNGKESSPEVEDKGAGLSEELTAEEEKKIDDDLWSKFLEGTGTKPKLQSRDNSASAISDNTTSKNITYVEKTSVKKNNDDAKARENRIFEFAGEKIVVENNIIKEKTAIESPESVSKPVGRSLRGRGSGGLSSVLDQINKKNKLSTLEKSKLDWNTYKKVEGIEEEIDSHNKGKEGYLDRQDFLERSDVRQYEIERDLRLSRRSNR